MRSDPPEGMFWDLDNGASYSKKEEQRSNNSITPDQKELESILFDRCNGMFMLYGHLFKYNYSWDQNKVFVLNVHIPGPGNRSKQIATQLDFPFSPSLTKSMVKCYINVKMEDSTQQ